MFKIANVALTILTLAVFFVVATAFAVFGPAGRDRDRGERGPDEGKPA